MGIGMGAATTTETAVATGLGRDNCDTQHGRRNGTNTATASTTEMDWNMDMTRYGDNMNELNDAYGDDDDNRRDDDGRNKTGKMATGRRHSALAEA